MAILLGEVKQRVDETSLPYYDGLVNVRFQDGAITPAWVDRIKTATLRELLSEILLDWDVLNDDGQPLVPKPFVNPDPSQPVTPELIAADRVAQWYVILGAIPLSLLWEITDAALAAVRTRRRKKPPITKPSLAA